VSISYALLVTEQLSFQAVVFCLQCPDLPSESIKTIMMKTIYSEKRPRFGVMCADVSEEYADFNISVGAGIA
jgi:hypothetical protein